MTRKQVIELLKSGDFTITYHDRCSPSLYKGKWKYEQLENKEEIEYETYLETGYCPLIVELLAKALGGKSDSI